MKNSDFGLALAQNVHQETPIEICVASTAEEKQGIYRLRYQIYAEEMSKNFPCMDHNKKLLYDELDNHALLVYAKTGSQFIGTLRINMGRIDDFPPFWADTLLLHKFLEYDRQQIFAYTSKFMVAQNYRYSTVPYLLSAKAYEIYCMHQIQFSFGVCNLHLLRLYEQFGFRRYGRNFVDPGYGLLATYVLLVDDIKHLRAVHSPFYRIARKRGSLDNRAAEWFYEQFSENSVIINSQLVSEEDLWNYLYTRLRYKPNQILSILQGVSDAEAKKFLHCCGVVAQCRAGDQIAFRGDICYELNILITGRLGSSAGDAYSISSGQCFGAPALVHHFGHKEDIYSITETEILVLAHSAFFKFRHSHPHIANKVIQNLGH